MTDTPAHDHGETIDEDRRNFIHIATGAAAFGGAAMFAWAAVDQWNPAADTKAASALDVDVSKKPIAPKSVPVQDIKLQDRGLDLPQKETGAG